MTWLPPEDLADWLACQEGWSPGQTQQLLSEIAVGMERLARQLTARVGRRTCERDELGLQAYVARLWKCLLYHWQRLAAGANLPFREVLRRVENGQLTHATVKTNVLWEVTLAQALEEGEPRAAEIFEQDYMPTVRAIAARVGGAAAMDLVENLAAELILDRGDRPPRIATYQGRTPLASWLRSVVVNLWVSSCRSPRSGCAALDGAELAVAEDPARAADERGCEELLRPVFARAIGGLPVEERLLLKLLILDGVPQHQLADRLGYHSGTLTRRRLKATTSVLASIREYGGRTAPRRFDDCLQLVLVGDDPQLRRRLGEILAQDVRAAAVPGREDPS